MITPVPGEYLEVSHCSYFVMRCGVWVYDSNQRELNYCNRIEIMSSEVVIYQGENMAATIDMVYGTKNLMIYGHRQYHDIPSCMKPALALQEF